jgi:hypothetical protein
MMMMMMMMVAMVTRLAMMAMTMAPSAMITLMGRGDDTCW